MSRLYHSSTLDETHCIFYVLVSLIRDAVLMKGVYRDPEVIDSLKPIIAIFIPGGVNPPTLRCPC